MDDIGPWRLAESNEFESSRKLALLCLAYAADEEATREIESMWIRLYISKRAETCAELILGRRQVRYSISRGLDHDLAKGS